MMATKPISERVAPVLLVLCGALVAWNWYLKPERPVAWGAVVLLLACMAVALSIRSSEAIRNGVLWGASIMAFSLMTKLATALRGTNGSEFSQRGVMVLMGIFLMSTGNTIPKTLTPLSAQHCDPAKVQAFQRFAGWAWVLTGLAFATAWIVLPTRIAQPLSFVLLVSCMLTVIAQIVRLRRSRLTEGGKL